MRPKVSGISLAAHAGARSLESRVVWPLRRRTELYTLEDMNRRMGLTVMSFCMSGVRAAWELT